MLNTMNYDIDITKEPPADDTARQYYFIEKAKAYVHGIDQCTSLVTVNKAQLLLGGR